jgi:hypothetical protein
MHLHVCMHLCDMIYIYIYIYVYIYLYGSTNENACMHMYVCMCVYIIYMHIHTCIHIVHNFPYISGLQINMFDDICVCIHMHIYLYMMFDILQESANEYACNVHVCMHS